jgi:hypothetical protein
MINRFGQWAYEPIALDALHLAWPRLQAAQAEVKHLIERHAEASEAVATLESGRQAAKELDLDAGATALRAGAGVPPPKAEPALERKVEGAIRTRAAYERAVSAAISELEGFKRKNASSLEADAARSLEVMRRKLSDSARETTGLYAEAEAAAASVKKLAVPAPPPPESTAAGQDTSYFPQFVATTSQRSAGPDRGTIERVLNHLTSGLA